MVWQQRSVHRERAIGVVLVGVCALGLATRRASDDEACRLEQAWEAGDLHFNETIDFRADASGTWTQGGLDGDAGHDRKQFRWARTDSVLTVTYDRDRRSDVRYDLARRAGRCYLTFHDHPFLTDGSGFTHFSAAP